MPPFQGEEDGSEPSEGTVARIKLVNARWTGVRFHHPGLNALARTLILAGVKGVCFFESFRESKPAPWLAQFRWANTGGLSHRQPQ